MGPDTWLRTISLGVLLTLSVLVISSCTDEPAHRASVPSPTAAPVGPTPTVALPVPTATVVPTVAAIPASTPTPVDPEPCEEGMIVPKGSGCWASDYPSLDVKDYDPEEDYLFEVDQLGRGSIRQGERVVRGPQYEGVHRGFTVINGSELTYTVLRAGPNEDGSWTVNEVLDRNPFPENWGSGFVTDIATPTPVPGPHFGGTLRVVSQFGVDSLDPAFTEAYTATTASSHIFETPLGWNSSLEVKPRVAESWDLSPDGLTYTFHLRDGLKFHNGDSVEAVDVVVSLWRWLGGIGAQASVLREFIDEDNPFSVVDIDTFTVNLDESYGQVPSAFARPYGAPFILPEEIAGSKTAPESLETDDLIGSGAYRLDDWQLGYGVFLEKFERYVAADGPPDLYVGGTVGYLERITWLEISDELTKFAGLETGEWDVVEMASFDYFQQLEDHPNIVVPLYRPGHRSWYQLIPSHPPFDDLNMRRAALFGTNVEEAMYSLGSDDLWDLCPAIYYCGTPLETDAGGDEWYAQFDPDRARRLLEESTYAGETIVMLNPADHGTITPTGVVIKRQLEEVGFNIDMPELDWVAVVARMGEPDTFALSVGWQSHWCCGDPISDTSGAGISPLWPKIPYVSARRLDWARETDPALRAAILDRYQTALYENVYNVYLGVFYPMFPHTADLKNFDVKAIPFYSNSFLDR